MSEGKILNHHVLNKPYLDDVTNNLIPMNSIVKIYQLDQNSLTSFAGKMMESNEFASIKKNWIKKLKKADLEGVIVDLEKYVESRNDTYSESELIQLTARLNRAERNFGKGIMKLEQYNLEMNQINSAILKFIDNLG